MVAAEAQLLQPCGEQGVKFLVSCPFKTVYTQMQSLLNHLGKFRNRNLVLKHVHERHFLVFGAIALGLRVGTQDDSCGLLILISVQSDLGGSRGLGDETAVLINPGTHIHHAMGTVILNAFEPEIDFLEIGDAHGLADVVVHLLPQAEVQLLQPISLISSDTKQCHDYQHPDIFQSLVHRSQKYTLFLYLNKAVKTK